MHHHLGTALLLQHRVSGSSFLLFVIYSRLPNISACRHPPRSAPGSPARTPPHSAQNPAPTPGSLPSALITSHARRWLKAYSSRTCSTAAFQATSSSRFFESPNATLLCPDSGPLPASAASCSRRATVSLPAPGSRPCPRTLLSRRRSCASIPPLPAPRPPPCAPPPTASAPRYCRWRFLEQLSLARHLFVAHPRARFVDEPVALQNMTTDTHYRDDGK